MRKNLSIRYVSPELGKALDAERAQSGKSLNETVLYLLERALGVDDDDYDNGLASLSGVWCERELIEFQHATSVPANTERAADPRTATPTSPMRRMSD